MLADRRLARSLPPLVVALLAGVAHADISASFLTNQSNLNTDLQDSSGIVTGSGSLDAVDLVFATGDSVQTIAPSSFLISGTTTGGVDDPTRGSSMRLDGDIALSLSSGSAGGFVLSLGSGLRLVNEGTGSLAATVFFEITSSTGDPLAYEVNTTGGAFGPLTALTGTIFGDGTLSAGTYAVSLNLTSDGTSDWSIRVVPTPGTAGILLGSLVLAGRRRR